MKPHTYFCIAAASLMATPLAYSATELWSAEGFSNPESALYDSARDVIYAVSYTHLTLPTNREV